MNEMHFPLFNFPVLLFSSALHLHWRLVNLPFLRSFYFAIFPSLTVPFAVFVYSGIKSIKLYHLLSLCSRRGREDGSSSNTYESLQEIGNVRRHFGPGSSDSQIWSASTPRNQKTDNPKQERDIWTETLPHLTRGRG